MDDNFKFDAVIIGAGVIGLAIAESLIHSYPNILIIEKEKKFGQHISSRNSEVIHSGIYYPTNSLKSKLCIKGNKLLYEFMKKYDLEKLEKLSVFGGDYETPDGTGVRDYIHVVDLAKGHVKALQSLKNNSQLLTVNLGTGEGHSVLEMIKAFEKASGKKVPYEIVPRRAGDIASYYADSGYALEKLGWKAELELDEMCEDAWRWQSMNPNGY